MEPWTAKFFKAKEFNQPGIQDSGEKFMDRQFIDMMDRLRQKCGFSLHINSGYRSPEYNERLSTTGKEGPHTTGRACDVRAIGGHQKYVIVQNAMLIGFTGIGIGENFIHLDNLDRAFGAQYGVRPNIWTY